MQTDSQKMGSAFGLAIKELELVLGEKKDITDLSRTALTTIGHYSRLKATEVHSDVLRFQVAKDLSKDKEELKKFVLVSTPQLNPVKKLKG
ncbi:MAG: hypothetical protein GY774_16380 [Planctomycetes bacterium]|nr:hypothetical protein [Planctomycetota bacterium]